VTQRRDRPFGIGALEKVVVALGDNLWHGHSTETLWAERLGVDTFRLRNVPFYAKGLSYSDVISVDGAEQPPAMRGVVAHGGHSTYRLMLEEALASSETRFLASWKRLEELGCTYERGTKKLVAVDVPPKADIFAVYAALEKGEALGLWEFEEGHCGHEVSRSPVADA
jgi:hypothetical protein